MVEQRRIWDAAGGGGSSGGFQCDGGRKLAIWESQGGLLTAACTAGLQRRVRRVKVGSGAEVQLWWLCSRVRMQESTTPMAEARWLQGRLERKSLLPVR
ncbi:isovaleryl-CoA dehydrogenase [Sesbania bispinosa]|nr:isovaleryl-CoA dehydrogenase [Sesbania bispinosa]